MIVRIKPLFSFFIVASMVVLCGSANALDSKTKAAEEAGALLFRDKGCTFCHGVGGIGTPKAPSLIDLPKDNAWAPARITNQILKGGQKMPPFSESLSDEEIAELLASDPYSKAGLFENVDIKPWRQAVGAPLS